MLKYVNIFLSAAAHKVITKNRLPTTNKTLEVKQIATNTIIAAIKTQSAIKSVKFIGLNFDRTKIRWIFQSTKFILLNFILE